MQKDIAIIIPHKGLGDIIFHNFFIESIYKHHGKKIILFANKSTKANLIYKENKYIKKIILIDLHRPKILFYLFKIINIYGLLNKFKYEKIYYTGNHKWHLIAIKILSNLNKIELSYLEDKKRFIIPSLKNYLKKLDIKYKLNFNINVKENVSKNFVRKITNNKKPWVFLSIDTSEDQIQIPKNLLIKMVNKLKNKSVYINTNIKNSSKLSFLNKNNIIKTNLFNIIEIYYIIKRSELFIGNESGPAIISSILKKKSIIFLNNNVLKESSKLPLINKRRYLTIKKISKKNNILLDLI